MKMSVYINVYEDETVMDGLWILDTFVEFTENLRLNYQGYNFISIFLYNSHFKI